MRVSRKLGARTAITTLALLAGLGGGAAAPRGQPPGDATPSPWTPVGCGVEVRRHVGSAERPGWPAWVALARVDPAHVRLKVVAAQEHGPPLRVADLATATGALVAVNGGFFDGSGRALGWVVTDGQERSPLARAGWGAFWVDAEGRPHLAAADSVPRPADARQALQAGPRLVVEGRPNRLRPQLARRAFVGVDAEGRLVLGATGPLPADSRALADFLATPESRGGAGLLQALALDGGSSAQFHVRGGGGDGSDLVLPGGVGVPNALLVLPPTGGCGAD